MPDAFNLKYKTLVAKDPYRVECRLIDPGLIDPALWTVTEDRRDDPSAGSFIHYETLRAVFTGPDYHDPAAPTRSDRYSCLLVRTVVRGEDPSILEPGETRTADYFARDLGDLDVGRAHRAWVKETRARRTSRTP
jgi:hypothetical protein